MTTKLAALEPIFRLKKASVDVLGEYKSRRVALQEVRFAFQDQTNNRKFALRLKDYKNLPETSLSELLSVLAVAKLRAHKQIQAATK